MLSTHSVECEALEGNIAWIFYKYWIRHVITDYARNAIQVGMAAPMNLNIDSRRSESNELSSVRRFDRDLN